MIPTKCKLWGLKNITSADLNYWTNFDILETFEDESHLIRRLLKCKECGQLYFYEFCEEIDWVNGDDPQWRKYIPVENQEEAEKMAQMSPLELLQFSPRLQDDSSKETIKWIR